MGIECRADDNILLALLSQITDEGARAMTTAERSLLAELRAGCHAPVGVSTTISGGTDLHLEAVVLDAAGRERISAAGMAPITAADALGRNVAQALCRQGADRLIAPNAGD